MYYNYISHMISIILISTAVVQLHINALKFITTFCCNTKAFCLCSCDLYDLVR